MKKTKKPDDRCPRCEGRGQRVVLRELLGAIVKKTIVCNNCDGTGKLQPQESNADTLPG